jgi:hypothetical protein
MYSEVVFDQRVETWLLCHRHAFESWQDVSGRVFLCPTGLCGRRDREGPSQNSEAT